MRKQQIIGGMFGLNLQGDPRNTPPAFLTSSSLLLLNARSCVALLIERLKPRRVWLPSYLCGVLTNRAVLGDAQTRFYPISAALKCQSLDWIPQVEPGDLVLLIDYFGFSCDRACAAAAKERGAWIVEDASQALLSTHVGENSDFVILSPRKFLGIPDGGILNAGSGLKLPESVRSAELQRPPPSWLQALEVSILRSEYDARESASKAAEDREWFHMFQKVDEDFAVGLFAISDVSRLMLSCGFDYPNISRKRCTNYRMLLHRLSEFALFKELPDDVVPLGFPICFGSLSERARVRQRLFAEDIFPPIHWTLNGVVPASFIASHYLADRIMTLPCDQRYGEQDMARIASLVLGEGAP